MGGDTGGAGATPRSRGDVPDATDTSRMVIDLDPVDGRAPSFVGGKAAQLGELMSVGGVRVPPGFCVTTAAFRSVISDVPEITKLVDALDQQIPGATDELSARIRARFEDVRMPDELAGAIERSVEQLGPDASMAVRSSATAEDLPTASFAGQHESFLHVVGPEAVLAHVTRCWASLFTDRAIAYRNRHGIDHRRVEMAVVVQRLVAARASGVLFTADPTTGNRTTTVIEATFGLGEALVSGLVDADRYHVDGDGVVRRAVATKSISIEPSPGGGTRETPVDETHRGDPVLTEQRVLELVDLGRRLEAHFDAPQDVEWCLDDDGIHVVQSRPITTLFPIPGSTDDTNKVYVSVGHAQMMTDPMTPLGLSVWQMTSPAPMRVAGGRLFVDVTDRLVSPAARAALLEVMGKGDPLVRDALETVVAREGFLADGPDGDPPAPPLGAPGSTEPIDTDPTVVATLIGENRASVARLRDDIQAVSGTDLFDFILADFTELRAQLFAPHSHQAVMAGLEATWWLNDNLAEWLGERNAADVLSLSAPHNVTSEMGLALLDVADVIRPHQDVIAFLDDADDEFLDELDAIPGGADARAAIAAYLDEYGMRCAGEIDIGRPRWAERPTALVPAILSNVARFRPGERRGRVEAGEQRSREKTREILERLRATPDGDARAAETEQMIDRLRTFIGYREYPKYGMVNRYFIYKQAVLAEAEQLVTDGVIDAADDAFFLAFDELHTAVRTRSADRDVIAKRREDFGTFAALTAPRVLTSHGEALNGSHHRDDPPEGALVGLAVSAGTVEGRARVVLDMADADLEPGDILVTRATDPSWSPLFVAAAGLVTEVGGLVTHGAVVAREYGLVAVVGVDDATRVIEDGERIRVDGTQGLVQRLPT